MNTMTPVNPPMAPLQPAQPAQTPQSQYLAAALKQLGTPAPATPAALGMDLGASALTHVAQAHPTTPGQGLISRFGGLLGLGQNPNTVQGAANSQVTI